MADKADIVKQGEQVVKRKSNGKNSPVIGDNGLQTEPGDNSRYLRMALVSYDLPPIDISDERQVTQRIMDYFNFCANNDAKPSMIGMANWLGIDRSTLNSWKRGEYRTSTHSPVIEKAVGILEQLWSDYMQNGKINPVSGIFMGKVFFGYKDVSEYVLTPNTNGNDDPATLVQAARMLPDTTNNE